MATTTAKGSGSTVNNGGTVVNAGNVASNSSVTNVIAVKDLKTGTDSGAKVVAQGGAAADGYAGVQTALGAGTLAYSPNASKGERNFVIRGAGDSAAKINNSASNLLKVGSRAPQAYTGLYTVLTGTTAGTMTFDILKQPNATDAGNGVLHPGKSVSGSGSATTLANPAASSSANTTATAVNPTRSVPGELTYMFGAKTPKQDDYKARDSAES